MFWLFEYIKFICTSNMFNALFKCSLYLDTLGEIIKVN